MHAPLILNNLSKPQSGRSLLADGSTPSMAINMTYSDPTCTSRLQVHHSERQRDQQYIVRSYTSQHILNYLRQ